MASVESEPTRQFSEASGKPWDIRVGDVVGERYQVTRLIGRGGMGVVVEALQRDTGQRVAIKILHTRHLDNSEAVARFTQEGRAYATMRGEHNVRIYDFGQFDARPFLVMELLSGSDLEAVMEEGPLPLELAALYMLQASEGMAEVHAHGMVHRDLKPSNLFLTSRPDGSPLIKILDFGIAKGIIVDDPAMLVQTQTLVAMGTPLYMSPEQIRSSREVDARADIWSLGAIFYELVAGRPAFGGNTVTHITAQVLEADPPPLSTVARGLPLEIDNLVRKALAKRPDDRFIDVASFAYALESFAGLTNGGTAARCRRILQGALRAGGSGHATTPPVTRDDALGGTIRFDRRRRVRLVQLGLGALAFATVVLVVLALNAYRRTPAHGQVLARGGLRTVATRLADAPAAPSVAQVPAITTALSATPSAAQSSAPAVGEPLTLTASPSAPGPRPKPSLGPGVRPTATAPKATASQAPYNPFSERN